MWKNELVKIKLAVVSGYRMSWLHRMSGYTELTNDKLASAC